MHRRCNARMVLCANLWSLYISHNNNYDSVACALCSVYAGKTSTPKTGGRTKGRRNVNSSTPVVTKAVAGQQKSLPLMPDQAPLSPISTQPPGLTADQTSISLQRTNSSQSSASAASSVSGSGGVASSSKPVLAGSGPKLGGPISKPHSTGVLQPPDVVNQAPSRRPGRDPCRRGAVAAPSGPADKPVAGGRSQSSPGDHRVKTNPTQATAPSRGGVAVPGVRSVTPRTHHHQQVDRSLGSVDAPALSAFVDRSGLVFDVRSKSAYRRGRLLGKVRTQIQVTVAANV